MCNKIYLGEFGPIYDRSVLSVFLGRGNTMEIFYKIIAMLGGLSVFLYGMRLMGDGLKSCSGSAM